MDIIINKIIFRNLSLEDIYKKLLLLLFREMYASWR